MFDIAIANHFGVMHSYLLSGGLKVMLSAIEMQKHMKIKCQIDCFPILSKDIMRIHNNTALIVIISFTKS